jgi:hypothetical protein
MMPVLQARIAEYFGVSEAMLAARHTRSTGWVDDGGDVAEALKKRAEESYEE